MRLIDGRPIWDFRALIARDGGGDSGNDGDGGGNTGGKSGASSGGSSFGGGFGGFGDFGGSIGGSVGKASGTSGMSGASSAGPSYGGSGFGTSSYGSGSSAGGSTGTPGGYSAPGNTAYSGGSGGGSFSDYDGSPIGYSGGSGDGSGGYGDGANNGWGSDWSGATVSSSAPASVASSNRADLSAVSARNASYSALAPASKPGIVGSGLMGATGFGAFGGFGAPIGTIATPTAGMTGARSAPPSSLAPSGLTGMTRGTAPQGGYFAATERGFVGPASGVAGTAQTQTSGIAAGIGNPVGPGTVGRNQAPARSEVASVVAAGPGWTTVQYADGRQEKRSGDRASRNNNPGNIEHGNFAISRGAVGTDGRFAVFGSPEAGRKAKEDLLDTPSYSKLSIEDAIGRYAPAFENDTRSYARSVAAAAGVSPNTKMSDLTASQKQAFVDEMARVEGNTGYRSTSAGMGQRSVGADIAALGSFAPSPPARNTGTQVASATSRQTAQVDIDKYIGAPATGISTVHDALGKLNSAPPSSRAFGPDNPAISAPTNAAGFAGAFGISPAQAAPGPPATTSRTSTYNGFENPASVAPASRTASLDATTAPALSAPQFIEDRPVAEAQAAPGNPAEVEQAFQTNPQQALEQAAKSPEGLSLVPGVETGINAIVGMVPGLGMINGLSSLLGGPSIGGLMAANPSTEAWSQTQGGDGNYPEPQEDKSEKVATVERLESKYLMPSFGRPDIAGGRATPRERYIENRDTYRG